VAGDLVAGHFRLTRDEEVSAMTTTWTAPESPVTSLLARNEEVSARTDLKGRACLVTGGSRGIGRAIALELGQRGASVAVGFVNNEEAAKQVADEIATHGGTAFAFGCDVQDAEAVEAAVASVVERFGKIDALVNNAGITRDRSLAKMSPEEWDAVIQTNLTSVFRMTSRVLPYMVEAGYGRIVNISSVIGLHGNFGQANYAAAKAGIVGFTKSAALELARKGVTVNAIAPGFIETEMIAAMPEEVREKILAKIPMGRFGKPEEIAQAAAYLISSGGDYITGQVLAIDGGLYT
jgi:3-oxoacyl-(acyl-carrier-protein) reductase